MAGDGPLTCVSPAPPSVVPRSPEERCFKVLQAASVTTHRTYSRPGRWGVAHSVLCNSGSRAASPWRAKLRASLEGRQPLPPEGPLPDGCHPGGFLPRPGLERLEEVLAFAVLVETRRQLRLPGWCLADSEWKRPSVLWGSSSPPRCASDGEWWGPVPLSSSFGLLQVPPHFVVSFMDSLPWQKIKKLLAMMCFRSAPKNNRVLTRGDTGSGGC